MNTPPTDQLARLEARIVELEGRRRGGLPRGLRRVVLIGLAMALVLPAGAVLAGSQRFSDVPPSHPFFSDIEAVAAAGLTSGCTPTTFCPKSNVTREQMAAFLNRLDQRFASRIVSGSATLAAGEGALVLRDPWTGAEVRLGNVGVRVVNTNSAGGMQIAGHSILGTMQPEYGAITPGQTFSWSYDGLWPAHSDVMITLGATATRPVRMAQLTCSVIDLAGSPAALSCILVR